MQLDEWRMFQITPFNREIQDIKLSPPLISQPTADSFPPGEAKGCKPLACTLCYRAYAFIRVLAKNRGCGRMRSAPTDTAVDFYFVHGIPLVFIGQTW